MQDSQNEIDSQTNTVEGLITKGLDLAGELKHGKFPLSC